MRNIQTEITRQLAQIERERAVKILFACESGSRAWGFASPDSDYDVRFIYLRPLDWYLSINVEHKRDVIELPIEDDLDINGWDVRKALQLLHKSNPPLLEWLGSPIIYQNQSGFLEQMQEVLGNCYSPVACAYHYRQMAKRNHDAYLKNETIKFKKYFYVLRPLLAVRWIEAGRGLVPTEFDKLLNAEFSNGALRDSIDELLQQKSASGEAQTGSRAPVLHDWIDEEMARVRDKHFDLPPAHTDNHTLDDIFRKLLKQNQA